MASLSRVLVFEYFSGGGCNPEEDLPVGLVSEGMGMLSSVLEDFRRWGHVRTITAFDARLENIIPGLNPKTLPADEVVEAFPGGHEENFLSLLNRCDAVLAIAPETDGILSRLIEQAEIAGISILGSSSSAAATAGDKAICSRLFDLAKLPAPATRIATFSSAPQIARRMGLPLVIKPPDGAGSEGVCLVKDFSDLPEILSLVRRSTSQEQILLQSLAIGIPASVTLLIAEDRCLPVSLNLQLIESGTTFKYQGSQVPLVHPAKDRAMELACAAAHLIPGLQGYVGIDMVLADDLVQLIEINPRLTTSYIGLRQVARVNLAQALWDACQHRILPDNIPMEGQVVIETNNPNSWNLHLA